MWQLIKYSLLVVT